MAILCRRYRYLFIAAPGTGCTATAAALEHLCAGTAFPNEDIRARGELVASAKHASLPQLMEHGYLSFAERECLLVFTTVRNPFDYWPSEWLRWRRWAQHLDDPDSWVNAQPQAEQRIRLALEADFDGFLRAMLGHTPRRRLKRLLRPWRRTGNRIWYPAARHLHGTWLQGVDRVLRFEHLERDFAEILRELGLENPPDLPAVNVTQNRQSSYRDYYSKSTRRLVERVFAPDLQRFGYRF